MASSSKRPHGVSEKVFLAQVRDLARLLGWLEFHVHDARRSPAGLPDLILVRPPDVLFAELKTSTGRVSPSQQMWLDALSACPGIETFLWRPDDWDTIVSRLRNRHTPIHGGTTRDQNGKNT